MRFTSFAAVSALAMGAIAAPLEAFQGFEMVDDIPDFDKRDGTCMSGAEAKKVAQNFRALIHDPFNTTLAQTSMTKDFADYSDSVIELIVRTTTYLMSTKPQLTPPHQNQGCTPGVVPLTSPTFTSRKEFIDGQSSQPPIPFRILKMWHNCDAVFMRWRSGKPGTVKPEQPVTGIIAIDAVPNPKAKSDQPWLMKTVYSEFNSGAWLYDLGIFVPECNADGTPANPPPTKMRKI